MHNSNSFVLHGGGDAFTNRQKALYDTLSVAEKECSKNRSNIIIPTEIETEESRRIGCKRKIETRKFSGKESIFKRPDRPAPRANFKSIPDHHRNPHKWTKYSLDVSPEDMSDRSNTQAAFSFLKELQLRKKNNTNTDEQIDLDCDQSDDHDSRKPVFKLLKQNSSTGVQYKKPTRNTDNFIESIIIDTDSKPVFRSSKIIMPEYVVGQKQKKQKVNKNSDVPKICRSKELKLDHLNEFDEDET